MSGAAPKLKFLFPGWYATVMGLGGLALAWHRAVPLMGELAGAVALVVGGLAALVFVLLAAATLWRGWHAGRGLGRRPPPPGAPHLHRHAADRACCCWPPWPWRCSGPAAGAGAVVGRQPGAVRRHAVGAGALVARCAAGRAGLGQRHAGAVHPHRRQRAGAAGRRAAGPRGLGGGAVRRRPAVLAAGLRAAGGAAAGAGARGPSACGRRSSS